MTDARGWKDSSRPSALPLTSAEIPVLVVQGRMTIRLGYAFWLLNKNPNNDNPAKAQSTVYVMCIAIIRLDQKISI